MCADTATIDGLVPLLYRPVKDSRDYYSLGDILANGQSLDGTMINILAAVNSVGMDIFCLISWPCSISLDCFYTSYNTGILFQSNFIFGFNGLSF